MTLKNRIKELEEALKPFAEYGLHIEQNILMKHKPKDAKIFQMPNVPTIGEFEHAAEVMPDVELKYNLPKLRKETEGVPRKSKKN